MQGRTVWTGLGCCVSPWEKFGNVIRSKSKPTTNKEGCEGNDDESSIDSLVRALWTRHKVKASCYSSRSLEDGEWVISGHQPGKTC